MLSKTSKDSTIDDGTQFWSDPFPPILAFTGAAATPAKQMVTYKRQQRVENRGSIHDYTTYGTVQKEGKDQFFQLFGHL